MKKPTLSIIIPTWNTADITLKNVQTIVAFLPPKFAEIIVVDNNSTDNTQQVFSKLKDIKYIKNKDNLGFSKANNIGSQQAIGFYLLFLNSDMELVDSSLVTMIDYISSRPQIGIIGPRFLNPDLTIQGSVFPPQTPLNAFKEYWLGIPYSYSKFAPTGPTPLSVWSISGGAVIISRELFNKIGGWDERYFFYYEDLELCRQVRKQHKEIFYYPQCTVVHRHGSSGKTLATSNNQWRRLIPSSILYHGKLIHTLIFIIMWSSQKFIPLFRKSKTGV